MLKMHNIPFFWKWFLIVSMCIYLGLLLSGPLGDFLYTHRSLGFFASSDGFPEGVLSALFLVGLFMGFGQWLVINTKIKRAYGWILATLIGFSIGMLVFFWIFAVIAAIADNFYRVYEWIWMIGTGAGAGISTGGCQWISLKRKLMDSIKWGLVMALGIVVGMFLLLLVASLFLEPSSLIFSITVGLISGLFAESLIIRPEIRQEEIAI